MADGDTIPGTAISVVTPGVDKSRTTSQWLNGVLHQKGIGGVASEAVGVGNVRPLKLSPLASVYLESTEENHVYFVDVDHLIQHLVRTKDGKWIKGPLSDLKLQAAPGAGFAASAVIPPHANAIPEQFLYFQDPKTYVIKEAYKTGTDVWKISTILNLSDSLANSNLAAVAYWSQGESKRFVYYQSAGLTLVEASKAGDVWNKAEITPENKSVRAPGRVPLSAITFEKDGNRRQLYWRTLKGKVVFSTNDGTKWGAIKLVLEASGYKFSVIQWEGGKRLRLFYQKFDGDVVEYYSNDSGEKWDVV